MQNPEKLIGKVFNINIRQNESADAVVISIKADHINGAIAKLKLVDFGAPIMSERVDYLLTQKEIIR